MVKTLNISLTQEQLTWVKGKKEQRGFASASDVVRDLIRREQEKEAAELEAEFEALAKRSDPGSPPVEQIVATSRKARKELLREHQATRRF
jgi:Arc/MetJ-type ribon-helix-helix transcriptional regulator